MKFTNEQHQAVWARGKIVAVSASAGTGKTTVLLGRVCHLVHQRGVDPSDILVLTFSRMARKQLQEKAEQQGVHGLNIQTFDGYALSIYSILRGGLMPSTLSQDELDWLLRDVAVSLGFAHRHGAEVRWLKKWTLGKARKIEERWDRPKDPDETRFLNELGRRMCDANVTTFRYTMARVLAALTDDGYKLREYCHVLVDEAQDMDERQHTLLAFHKSRGAEVFAVGDIRQCIYEWRDAAPQLWTDLCQAAELHTVTETFRCAHAVASLANRIAITGINPRLPGMISARAEAGGVYHWPEPTIAEVVRVMPRDHSVAVLCRTNSTADIMAGELTAAGIDHARLRPVKHFLAPGELQGLIQLKCIRCPAYHRNYAGTNAYPVPTDCDETTPFPEIVEWYRSQGLAVFPETWVERFEPYNVAGVIATVEAQSRNDFRESQQNQRVIVATVHGVKGLEFDHVVIADPSYDAWEGRGDAIEQARIAYVAVTRARLSVNIMAPADNAPLSRYFQGGK